MRLYTLNEDEFPKHLKIRNGFGHMDITILNHVGCKGFIVCAYEITSLNGKRKFRDHTIKGNTGPYNFGVGYFLKEEGIGGRPVVDMTIFYSNTDKLSTYSDRCATAKKALYYLRAIVQMHGDFNHEADISLYGTRHQWEVV